MLDFTYKVNNAQIKFIVAQSNKDQNISLLLMSHLPQISQEQRSMNIKKLINQNKKLRQQIFVFEQQINSILYLQEQQTRRKLQTPLVSKPGSPSRRSSKISFNQSNITSPDTKQTIQQLLQINSPLIQTKVIPQLKQKVEFLKSLNIKQNVEYILKEQDDLKILKYQLYKLRRQKQVVTDFVKEKAIRQRKQNTELENHKSSLRQQLKQTVKYNRQTSLQITQMQRQIRKYHLTLRQFKKLSASVVNDPKDKASIDKIKTNPQNYLKQVQAQIEKYRKQIFQVQNKWKDQVQALDKEHDKLKQQLQKKQQEQKTVKSNQSFHNTRILVMKDQASIKSQKQKQKLVQVSPLLQKQLSDYLKQQQQKIKKKQQYLKKHLPRDKQQEELEKIMIEKEKRKLSLGGKASTQNPQNILVESLNDDKNIMKLKSYFKARQKIDKEVEAKLKNAKKKQEKHRLQRSWSRTQEEIQAQTIQNEKTAQRRQKQKQRFMPRLLLKSVKLGTTFHNQSSQQQAMATAR